MTWGTLPEASLCLFSGVLLGLAYLTCKLLRVMLGLGRWASALLDVLFCLLCALTAFLCALVLDKGRLRLFQAALQLLGGWAAAAALGPLVERAARLVKRVWKKISRLAVKPLKFLGIKLAKTFPKRPGKPAKEKKPGRKRKNPKKPLEKLT